VIDRSENVEASLWKQHLANNLAASGHFDEAAEEASAAIKLRPSDCSYRLLRAKLNYRLGKNDLAKEDLRIAVAHDTFDLNHNFELEKLLVRVGDYKLVVETIQPILLTIPKGCPEYRACFQYLLAQSQEQLVGLLLF
jgi:tetratricopeptide (TPR) repeat protein